MIMKSTFKGEIFINSTKLGETPLFPRGIVGQHTCLEETPLFPGASVGQQICPDKRPISRHHKANVSKANNKFAKAIVRQ